MARLDERDRITREKDRWEGQMDTRDEHNNWVRECDSWEQAGGTRR